MLKHIGRHGDRKVAIVFREIPNEEHMCLVIYPDVLPTHIHNSVMSVLESAPGQQASNLADVFLLVEPTIGGAIRCGLYTQQRRSGYVIM